MARFVPSSPPVDIIKSERKVWEGLRALPDEWVIHHSVEWQGLRDGKPDDGEADFVLIHPEHGVIIVEVKGGSIDVTPDQWFSVNESGRHRIKNPFKQVQDSKRALLRYLRRRLEPCPRIPVGHVVIFPDVSTLPRLGPEAPDELAWRGIEVRDAAIAMEALCEHWSLDVSMGPAMAEAITEALAPEGTIRVRRSDEVATINAQIEAWTRDQAEVFATMTGNRQLLVYGGAGTGKTVLAIELAAELSSEGKSVLLTCYNRPLGEHLRSELEGLADVEAVHFHKLCTDLATEAHAETGDEIFQLPRSKTSEFWQSDAPAILVEAADALDVKFDAVIVDEGQDFAPTWFEALEALLDPAGPQKWVVFADSHQAIYQPEWTQPFDGSVARLRRNCRNTRQIAEKVSAIWDEEADAHGVVGRPPEFIAVESLEGAKKAVKALLHRLINEGNLSPDQVTLICQQKSDVSALRGSRLAGITLAGQRGDRSVLVETIHRFKGLESDAVIVILSASGHIDRSLAYIGVSRASAELFVVGPDSVRSALNW